MIKKNYNFNELFYFDIKEREEFLQKQQATKVKNGINEEAQSLSGINDDEISIFYKRFLDQNHKMHVQYNFMWYKKNFELLVMAFTVQVERLINKIKERKKDKL